MGPSPRSSPTSPGRPAPVTPPVRATLLPPPLLGGLRARTRRAPTVTSTTLPSWGSATRQGGTPPCPPEGEGTPPGSGRQVGGVAAGSAFSEREEPDPRGDVKAPKRRDALGNLVPRAGVPSGPMDTPLMPPSFVAVISPVREVSLHGSADLARWRDYLRAEGLAPAEVDGRARILVSAIESSFQGKRFREAVISVAVADRDAVPAGFLGQAFNSSRLFAFVERRIFRTPYVHARVALDAPPGHGFEVALGSHRVLRAALRLGERATARLPLRTGEECFEGRIHLPSRPGVARSRGRWFHARLEGEARTYAFEAALDELTIDPVPAHPMLAHLVDSGFIGETWAIRDGGTHGRSKTFRGPPA